MNNLKSNHFRASILSFVPLNKIFVNILNPIYRSPYNHQELEWAFCCRAQLRLHTISFFAIYTKTKDFRASELPCVPINSTIAVILNPILRYLRPSGAEIGIPHSRLARYGFSRITRKRKSFELQNCLASS